MKRNIVQIDDNTFDVTVAITAEEHERGLMYVDWPPPVMAFPYKVASIRKFWMKNTPSPLDIIFSRAGVIVGIYDGDPFNLNCVGPNEPIDLVVEMPRGHVDKFGISVGDDIKLSYSAESLVKIMKHSF